MTVQFVSAGGLAAGTGGVNVGWGAGHAAGHLGLMLVETGQESVATPAGWAIVPTTPALVATAGRLSMLYKFAASGAEGAVAVGDPGDHIEACILVFSGVHATDPFAFGTAIGYAAATAMSYPPAYNVPAGSMILNVAAWAADNLVTNSSAEANASLDGGTVAERFDAGSADGNGGGLVAITGMKSAGGEVSPTTATFAVSTSYVGATLALRPAAPPAAFAKTGQVIINGVAAANGQTVEIWDDVLKVRETTAVTGGGNGSYTANVQSNAANRYFSTFENGTKRGRSKPWTAT